MSSASEVLAPDEIDDFWALGIPLEVSHVPEEELVRAIAETRVQIAVSTGSMGTAETYWTHADATDNPATVQAGVVVPRGRRAYATPYEEWADDRDVVGVLWRPFYREQQDALAGCIPDAQRPMVLAEYARVLGELERSWANGPKLVARAPLIAALYAVAPADAARVNGWLASHTKLPHLVRGVRTRWVSHDVAAAFAAVMESAERFQDKAVSARCMRLSLLRFAVRLVRERPAPQIAIGGAAIHLEDSYGAQLSTLLRANGETIDESSLTKLVEQATRELLTATPKPHPGPPVLTPIERCKTCANLDQRVALDYERGAVRPSILDSLVPIATMRTDESSESWGVRSVLRCRSCGTFYSVVRSKDEGHSFMDPTHDTEAITRLSLHAAIDTLGMFGGPGAAEARAAHALRVALVTEALVAMIARDAAPNWHLQKYACECLTQAALLNDDRDLLESLLVRNPNPIVRVHIALELVELAHGFQPYVGRGALKQGLEQAARGWLAEHSLAPVLAGVLAVAPLPSLRPSSVGDQTVATDTHAIALKALGIAADLAQRIDDDAFERVIEQLGSASEEHRFEAVWALIWIVKAAPVRGSAIRARLDQLPAAVRASPVLGLLAGKVR